MCLNIFDISVSIFRWVLSCKTKQIVRLFSIQGFRLFNSSTNIVLTFELGHDITILKMAIFDEVDSIGIEPRLVCTDSTQMKHIMR